MILLYKRLLNTQFLLYCTKYKVHWMCAPMDEDAAEVDAGRGAEQRSSTGGDPRTAQAFQSAVGGYAFPPPRAATAEAPRGARGDEASDARRAAQNGADLQAANGHGH